MSDHETTDALKALRDELASVAPSPDFATRVRQGIEADADARRGNWLSGWRWFVPAAAAAAVVIAAFVWSSPGRGVADTLVARAPITAGNPVENFAGASASVPKPAGVQARSSSVDVRTPKSGGRTREPENPSTREPENPFPEVITNQPEVLRALWARLGANATLVESTPEVLPDAVQEIVVTPIEVAPIVVKWLGDPQAAPGVPIIRKVTADTAERSAK